jgi:hypothetical protein
MIASTQSATHLSDTILIPKKCSIPVCVTSAVHDVIFSLTIEIVLFDTLPLYLSFNGRHISYKTFADI